MDHKEFVHTVDTMRKQRSGKDWLKLPKEVRAVLEVAVLHKPYEFELGGEMFTGCEGCGELDFPCKTIKAFEKA